MDDTQIKICEGCGRKGGYYIDHSHKYCGRCVTARKNEIQTETKEEKSARLDEEAKKRNEAVEKQKKIDSQNNQNQ